MSDNFLKVYNGLALKPRSTDPTNPAEGDLQFSDGTVRGKGLWEYKDASWQQVGGGGGSLDVYHSEDFEATAATDFTKGNNATFLGAGSLNGALSDETVSPIAGNRSIKYVAGAASLNDYIASPVIDLDDKQKENDSGITFYFTWDGSIDIEVVMWDETNSTKLNSVLDVINVEGNPTRYSATFYPSSTTTQIRYGFHFLTAPTNGDILVFDDLELSTNPFVYKELTELGSWDLTEVTSTWSRTGSNIIYRSAADPTFNIEGEASALSFTNDGTDGFKLIATKDCLVNAAVSVSTTSGTGVNVLKNGTLIRTGGGHTFTGPKDGDAAIFLAAGDYLTWQAGALDGARDTSFTIGVQSQSEHVITPATSNLTDWAEYTPTLIGFGTATNSNFHYRRVGDTLEIQGFFTSGTSTATLAQIPLPSISGATLLTDTFYNNGVGSRDHIVGDGQRDDGSGIIILADSGLSYLNMSHDASATALTKLNGSALVSSGQEIAFFLAVKIEGWSSDVNFLAAIPTQKVAYIKDVKATTVNGGTFTSGAWQTRDLNTIIGDSEIVSISSNQFTLNQGVYIIEVTSPAYRVEQNKAKLYNITDASDEIIGSANMTSATGNTHSESKIIGRITLTSTKVFEVQHRCSNTVTTSGMGLASSYGVSEIYTQVKITKLR